MADLKQRPAHGRQRKHGGTRPGSDPVDSTPTLIFDGGHAGHQPHSCGPVKIRRLSLRTARQRGFLPARVREARTRYGGDCLRTLGDASVLDRPKLALLCSVHCPGILITATYDLVQRLRRDQVTVVSGFHSPMERECLTILLRSTNAVIWCLARGMTKTIPPEFRSAVHDGRLLIVSSFSEDVRRVTAETAAARNSVVADMASALFVPHAAPGSKIEALCRNMLSSGKPVYAFDHPDNATILKTGARPTTADMDWTRILNPACTRDQPFTAVQGSLLL